MSETIMSEENKVVPAAEETVDENDKSSEDTENGETKNEPYLGQKKRAEKAEAEAKALQVEIEKLRMMGVTGEQKPHEISDSIKSLALEYNVDENFLSKVFSTVEKTTTAKLQNEIDKKYSTKIDRLEQERQMEKAEKKFEQIFDKTIKEMPEYDGVVNKDVIKSLAFNPSNAKKTLQQIVEETYSNAITGRKSIESSHASKEPTTPDILNPSAEDWSKIESSPEQKDKWSKSTEEALRRYM